MKEYNLHTHTVYCGHGEDLPHDYAERAVRDGLRVLGFSEHLPFPDRRLCWSRMDIDTKPAYLKDIEETKRDYEGRLDILIGWECDYFPDMEGYYSELEEETDYLTFGCHFLKMGDEYLTMFRPGLGKREIGLYADNLISGMETGHFDFVAHPDLFFFGYEKFDDEARAVSKAIIECAVSHDIPLEINGNGLIRKSPYPRPPYPMKEFDELARDMGATFIGSTDAHKAEHVAYSLPFIDDWVRPMGIELRDLENTHPLEFRKAR